MRTPTITEPPRGIVSRDDDTPSSQTVSRYAAERALLERFDISPRQARMLVRAYVRDLRDADAREFVREHFELWSDRRGDIVQAKRSPWAHAWRLSS